MINWNEWFVFNGVGVAGSSAVASGAGLISRCLWTVEERAPELLVRLLFSSVLKLFLLSFASVLLTLQVRDDVFQV
jgi:hypothetical protein